MIRPHLRDIPLAAFPEGFRIRPLQVEEGRMWTDIVLDAEAYLSLSEDLFEKEFGADLQAVPQRCFLIVDEGHVGVGTISAWYNRDYQGLDYGVIHWVAVRPAYQGIGLGRAGMSFALTRMAQWHERAMLSTQTRRLPAIKMYLNFGFLPELDREEAVEIWKAVHTELGHPALERALQRRDGGI
jgi:GNAT superfamily N-acetyltransferase